MDESNPGWRNKGARLVAGFLPWQSLSWHPPECLPESKRTTRWGDLTCLVIGSFLVLKVRELDRAQFFTIHDISSSFPKCWPLWGVRVGQAKS